MFEGTYQQRGAMQYYDFEVAIERIGDLYRTRAEAEGMGEASAQLALKPDSPDLVGALERLTHDYTDIDFLTAFGKLLFDGLFIDQTRELYRVARLQALKEDRGLSFRLRIDPPEIAALPWELLYDEGSDTFLATSARTPLIRYTSPFERAEGLKAELPLKALVVISASEGLDIAREKAAVTKALSDSGDAIEADFFEDAVTRSAIGQMLTKDAYNILHFIGAGDAQDNTPRLIITSADGKRDLIGARSLAGFCAEAPGLRLVVFSPLNGAPDSETRPLGDLASELVGKGVAATIGFRYPISAATSSTFFTELYRRLSKGSDHGRIDAALAHARNKTQNESPEARDFVSPVAFTRLSSGVIFDFETSESEQVEPFAASARTWRKMSAAVLAAGLIVFAANWVGLLDFADRLVDRKFTALMDDYVNLTFAGDKIAMIVADGDSRPNGALGEFSEEWRPRHAELIKGLVKAGASVVALDIAFDRSNRFGTELRTSIDQASGTATKVILGVADFDPDLQIPKPLTMDALRDIPAENWALTEAGLGPQGSRYLSRLLLALHPNKQPDQRPHLRTISVVPSLALQAFTQAEAGGRKVKAAFIKENRAIELRDEAGRVIKSIPVLDDQPKPENQMDVIVGLADQADLDHASIPYQQVYGNLNDQRYLSRIFAGKIVLVGVRKDDDRWQVSPSQQRYGFEIHATTISNLLQEVTIRPLRWGGGFAVIVFMSAVALAAQTVLSRWKGPTLVLKEIPLIPLKSEREVKIPVMLVVIFAIYVVFAFLAYKSLHLIVNITYPTTALLLAYFWIGFIKNKAKPKTA